MRSTRGPRPHIQGPRWLLAGLLGWLLAAPVLAANTVAEETYMPRPAALEADVHFWVRVYTEVDTNSGFLHDQWHLGVVYETLHFGDASPRERSNIVENARNRITASLRRIAVTARDEDLSPEDRKVKALWGADATPRTFQEAADNVRFQLGQSDRFRAGLERSGAWEKHIEETFAKEGLPPELAVLPHIESSFNPTAYSKVAAAGMWQFMRSTGRRYLRIDSSVDERMDPFKSTEAAAQLLDFNYRLLGTWPLALTAYNHGAGGMRRAKETMGTDDIVKIVRGYRSPSFGFASRNYYVSFLAALEVDRNPTKYFPGLKKQPEIRFQEVTVPAYVSVSALARAVKVDIQTLREFNPGLLRAVWDGKRRVPRNYRLHLPDSGTHWSTEMLAQHLKPGELYAGQPQPRRHRVKKGETLASLARQYDVSVEELARSNRLRANARLSPGRTLTIPAAVITVAEASRTPPAPTPVVATVATATPVARREESSSSSSASASSLARADVTNIYVVKSDDSFSQIAAGHGMSETELLRLNGLRNEEFIFPGQELVVKGPEPAQTPPVAAAQTVSQTPVQPPASPPVAAVVAPQPPPASGEASSAEPVSPQVSDTVGTGEVLADGGAVPAEQAQREQEEDDAASENAPTVEASQPVSAAQVEEITPSVGPALEAKQGPDPTDYTISKDGSIRVAPTESLGQYAEWLDVTPAQLAQLNHMRRGGRPVMIGHRIKLDFHKVSQKQFLAKRRAFHEGLQAAYFASHRIVGTTTYVARKGDTYWHIAQRFKKVPVWLMQQYNPDLDFEDVRAGIKVVVPRVEAIETGEDD